MTPDSNDAFRRQLDTRCIHAGEPPEEEGALFSPLYAHSTFGFSSTEKLIQAVEEEEDENLYTRYGQNPTIRAAEKKIADLEGGEQALVFGSGIAAISAVFLAHGSPSGRVVCVGNIYGGTRSLLTDYLQQYNLETSFVPRGATGQLEETLTGEEIVFFETPTNPKLEIIDIQATTDVAEKRNTLSVVDNTFATPVHQNPLELGADLTVHSATKYLGGHSDLTGGVVIGSRDHLEPIRRWRKHLGQIMAPKVAYLLARSLRTLPVRVRAQTDRAQSVAEFLDDHPRVLKVNYPGLPDSADYALARRQMRGFGAMVSFEYDGRCQEAAAVADALEIFTIAPSLGGVESLVTQPLTTSHRDMDPAERRRQGIPDNMLRLSIGLEGVEDLIGDLDQALDCR